jgi:hypothetical protein
VLVATRALAAALLLSAPAAAAEGQAAPVPYPEARPLATDEAFVGFQMMAAARAAGFPEDRAAAMLAHGSFATPALVAEVLDHLAPVAMEVHREPIVDRDAGEGAFIRGLDDAGLTSLVRALGVDGTGRAYARAYLAALAAGRPGARTGGFAAVESEAGGLVLYEVQRPYLDVGTLRWVDATRIRVVRFTTPGG